MKAEDKLQIGKFLFMLINSFFIILGISIFGASVWILFDTSNVVTVLSDETAVKVVAGGMFVIGLLVVCVSILGCVGVHLENRCFVALYMGILIAIIFGELFVTFLLLLKQNQIEQFLTESVDKLISMYGVNDTQTTWSLLDSVQQSAKCCGRQNASDWKTNQFIQLQNTSDIYPCSCFSKSCSLILTNQRFGNGTDIYTMGCEDKLKDWFEKNVLVIIGMNLALAIIQILQFIMGFFICRNIGRKIKDRQSENLFNAMEGIPSSSSEPHHNELVCYQPHTHTSDLQVTEDAYNGQGYYQHQHQHQPNVQMYDQTLNADARPSYDPYESQPYHHHHSPAHNHQNHHSPEHHQHHQHHQHQNPADGFTQHYADMSHDQYEEQQYLYEHDLHHRQSDNQGYVHDEYRNNYRHY